MRDLRECREWPKASADAQIVALALAMVADALCWLGNGDAITREGSKQGAIEMAGHAVAEALKEGLHGLGESIHDGLDNLDNSLADIGTQVSKGEGKPSA